MLKPRLARRKIATALVAAYAVLALASPLAVAATGSSDHRPAGAGSGKRVR
jgi:hypothetical protein